MHTEGISFFVFSRQMASPREVLGSVLERLRQDEAFQPDDWGFEGPRMHPIENASPAQIVDEALNQGMWNPLVLRNREDSVSFLIEPSPRGSRMACVSGGLDQSQLDPKLEERLVALVDDLFILTNGEYAQIANHSTPGAEMPFELTVRLPDIPNISYYGPACIAHFGLASIHEAPFALVRPLGDHSLRLHASASLSEAVPRELQTSIRSALGEQTFMEAPRWRYTNGSSPFAVVTAP